MAATAVSWLPSHTIGPAAGHAIPVTLQPSRHVRPSSGTAFRLSGARMLAGMVPAGYDAHRREGAFSSAG